MNHPLPRTALLAAALAGLAAPAPSRAQQAAPADPTRPSPLMRAAMQSRGGIPSTTVKGVVVGAGREGAVMLDIQGHGAVLARPGVPFTIQDDGVPRTLAVRAIGANGVELEAPVEKEVLLLPSLGPAPGQPAEEGRIALADFRDLPLRDALRMLAEQSGRNYSVSSAASATPVNALLRGVTSDAVVEEICKSHNLWFRREESTGILRILTVQEYQRDLVDFREERTEVFTLLYPNVFEVAMAIADLYGDRVSISFGAEGMREESIDLESRFDRFEILNRRSQVASPGQGGTSYSGSSSLSSGYGLNDRYQDGTFSLGQTSLYGRYGRRYGTEDAYGDNRGGSAADRPFGTLTPMLAERLDKAMAAAGIEPGAEAKVDSLRRENATIFVTTSRRNNMVMVRTADARVIEQIRALVRQLDLPTPMVLLEVKVLRVELEDGMNSVFDYQFGNGEIGAGFTQGVVDNAPDGGRRITGTGLRNGDLTFVIVSDTFRARMQVLEKNNQVEALATPVLLTANNEVSRLFLGEERPLVRGISSQTLLTDNTVATTPNTTVEFESVGNTLVITPNINSDRTVTLRLLQENSFINPAGASIPVVTGTSTNGTNVQNIPVDVVGTRSVSGTFVAKDGLAVVVGGLIENEKVDRRSQVPFLGRIPFLGALFRRQEKVSARRELLVMIRPRVISTPAEAEDISGTLLRDLSDPALKRDLEQRLLPLRAAARAEAADPRAPVKK